MNMVFSGSAYPFGKLSDRMKHSNLLILGLIVLIAADIVLASNVSWVAIFTGVSLWGLHMGMTQGLLSAMIAHTSPADLRGTAYGFFNLISGVSALIASLAAGFLWENLGASFTFYTGAGLATTALVGLAIKAHKT
jgi:MFS family permease